MSRPCLVLASTSPARLATLRAAGVEPTVVPSEVDESAIGDGLPAAELVHRLAGLKCDAVAGRRDLPAGALVLACDSLLELDGEALGKPGTAAEATARWQRMRDRTGVLHSGHALHDTTTGRRVHDIAASRVRFADVDDEEIAAYVATGEPLEVAGAFTVDGRGGAYAWVEQGDHHTVVGVSLPLLRTMVGELGYRWHDLWADRPTNDD